MTTASETWYDVFRQQFDTLPATKPVTEPAPPVTKPAPWDPIPAAAGGANVTEPALRVTKPVTEPAPMTTPTARCVGCGGTIRQNWNGRPRRTCSNRCRQRVYRRRNRKTQPEVEP